MYVKDFYDGMTLMAGPVFKFNNLAGSEHKCTSIVNRIESR